MSRGQDAHYRIVVSKYSVSVHDSIVASSTTTCAKVVEARADKMNEIALMAFYFFCQAICKDSARALLASNLNFKLIIKLF